MGGENNPNWVMNNLLLHIRDDLRDTKTEIAALRRDTKDEIAAARTEVIRIVETTVQKSDCVECKQNWVDKRWAAKVAGGLAGFGAVVGYAIGRFKDIMEWVQAQ